MLLDAVLFNHFVLTISPQLTSRPKITNHSRLVSDVYVYRLNYIIVYNIDRVSTFRCVEKMGAFEKLQNFPNHGLVISPILHIKIKFSASKMKSSTSA